MITRTETDSLMPDIDRREVKVPELLRLLKRKKEDKY